MDKTSRIYVAGHKGLVGSAIMRRLQADGYRHLIVRDHDSLDLMDGMLVDQFFNQERPEYVFLAAAKVGGIMANNTFPAEFIQQNLTIQTNVIHTAHCYDVKRLIFLGSSCIYPRDCPQPIKEEYLLTGELEPTNRPYSVAKIAGIETCRSYNRQYGAKFLSVMPSNVYGPGDNYDLQSSHVLPALIRKIHEATLADAPSVEIWGSGKPRREFLYVDDLADACLFLANLGEAEFQQLLHDPGAPGLINVGTGEDLTIESLANLIRNIVGFTGQIIKDESKMDGTPRKLLDSTRLNAQGWRPKISLRDGLKITYQSFLA